MKRLAIAISALAAMGLSSTALAAGAPSGTYKTKVHTNALHGALNGTWTISFKNGAYTVTDDGAVVVRGKYSIKATKITLKDKSGKDACPAPGTYQFKASANKLTFTKISDSTQSCAGRVTVLKGSFTRI